MRTPKHFILAFAFGMILATSSAYSQASVEELLAGYLQNDLTLQKLSSQVQQKMLSSQSAQIENGFSFKIQSGTVTIRTGENSSVKFTPSATFSLPQARNLELNVSSSIDISSSETSAQGTSFSLSMDIISSDGQKRELSLLQSQRQLLEAKRSLQNGYLSAEKEFYTKLKSLYSTAIQILTEKKSLYDSQLSLSQLTAQGYRTTSTKYRSAQISVMNAQHTVEQLERELERNVKILASKCGVEYTFTDPMDFLPQTIPQVQAVDVLSFDKDSYTKTESVLWTQHVNSLQRQADSAITLTGNAGYTIANKSTGSDTIDAGTSFSWNGSGLKVNAGVSVPVGTESFSPVYTLSFSFDPNSFRLSSIEKQQVQFDIEQEEIDLRSARSAYETSVIERQTELANIQWNLSEYQDSYKFYSSQETEMLGYYRSGYITESEYKTASVNREKSRIQVLMSQVDLIIYNQETSLLFCRDQELSKDTSSESLQ